MDGQKTTSKTTLLNLMILKAWKARWDDCNWGINIKTVLPRGVSGDVYNLADCIVQQAIVGSGANQLLLGYLKHSLCSHLVSHAAVIKSISKNDILNKYHCVVVLLDFLDSIIDGVTCRSKPEEGVLPNAMLTLINFLMQIFSNALDYYTKNGAFNNEHKQLQTKASVLLEKIAGNQFLLGVICLGKHEDTELATKLAMRLREIDGVVQTVGVTQNAAAYESLHKIVQIDAKQLEMVNFEPVAVEPITYCLQPLLAVNVLLNPSTETHQLINEFLMIQRLKGYSDQRLYCEIFRACFIALNNVTDSHRESLWCAFTFIKIPHILKQMTVNAVDFDEKLDYAPDVIKAIDLLMEDTPILDFMDTKCACDTIECLLTELKKQNLVNEKHIKHYTAKRALVSQSLPKLETKSIVKFVIRVEPPMTGILKTLSKDYNHVQEALLGMLCQVLSGNSFQLILSVATVEGKLKTFVQRLIKCNESSKQVAGETDRAMSTRASLFDVSFLMLSSIVQTYGSDIVLEENGNSFFEKWVRDCMVERNKTKSPLYAVRQCDQAKVDELIVCLTKDGLKNTTLKWHDVCANIPGLLYQVLLAWENESLSAAEVKLILDSLRVRMCAFSVCAASWLCAYMQIVKHDELLKPMNMMQQLLKILSADEMSEQENFKERLNLTNEIIRKMQTDFHPAGKIRVSVQSSNLVSQVPLEEQFNDVWKSILEHAWLPLDCSETLNNLLQVCGPFWLVNKLVNRIFQCKYVQEMSRTQDIVFAIMHLNIEKCTISLLTEIIPMLLLNKMQNSEMIEPQSRILAKLCVYCVISAIEAPAPRSAGKKRSADSDDTPSKVRKPNSDVGNSDSCSNDFPEHTFSTANEPLNSVREPLQSALQQLLKIFSQYVVTDELTPKVYFIFQFLSLLVQFGGDRIKSVLRLPSGLVQNVLKIIPIEDLTMGFVVRSHDLSLTAGRQNAITDLCLLRNIQIRKDSIKL